MAGAAAAAAAASSVTRRAHQGSAGTAARTQAMQSASRDMAEGKNPIVPVEIMTDPCNVGDVFTVRIELIEGQHTDMTVELIEFLGMSRAGSRVYRVKPVNTVVEVQPTELSVVTSNRGYMIQDMGYLRDATSAYFEITQRAPQSGQSTTSNNAATPTMLRVLLSSMPRQVGDDFEVTMTLWGLALNVDLRVVGDLGPNNGVHRFEVAVVSNGTPGRTTTFELLSPVAGNLQYQP